MFNGIYFSIDYDENNYLLCNNTPMGEVIKVDFGRGERPPGDNPWAAEVADGHWNRLDAAGVAASIGSCFDLQTRRICKNRDSDVLGSSFKVRHEGPSESAVERYTFEQRQRQPDGSVKWVPIIISDLDDGEATVWYRDLYDISTGLPHYTKLSPGCDLRDEHPMTAKWLLDYQDLLTDFCAA
jgi:hypothetical protein